MIYFKRKQYVKKSIWMESLLKYYHPIKYIFDFSFYLINIKIVFLFSLNDKKMIINISLLLPK